MTKPATTHFKSAGARRTDELHDCFEASMDYETALGCAGLEDTDENRRRWQRMERVFNS